jgi:hypothetical protein
LKVGPALIAVKQHTRGDLPYKKVNILSLDEHKALVEMDGATSWSPIKALRPLGHPTPLAAPGDPSVAPKKLKVEPSERKLILSSVQRLLSELKPSKVPNVADHPASEPQGGAGLRRSTRIKEIQSSIAKLRASPPSEPDVPSYDAAADQPPKTAPGSWLVYRDLSKIYIGQLRMECKDGQFLVYSGVMNGSVFNYDYVSAQDAQIKNSPSPLGPGWSLAEYVVNQRTIMGVFAPTATVPREALEMMADFARDPRQFPFK